jgi:hypothetical protein
LLASKVSTTILPVTIWLGDDAAIYFTMTTAKVTTQHTHSIPLLCIVTMAMMMHSDDAWVMMHSITRYECI